MYKLKHESRKSIAIIGLPRSGSSIACSIFNSIDRCSVWGEPHVSVGIEDIDINSRYGKTHVYGQEDILGQIEGFANQHNLLWYGFKETYNKSFNVDPVDIVNGYGDRLDMVFVMCRDVRKMFSSIICLGHHNSIPIPELIYVQHRMYNYVRENDKAIPVFMDMFIEDPKKYIRDFTGHGIKGELVLEEYTGGGDPYVMRGNPLKHVDTRPPYSGGEVADLEKDYLDLRRLTWKA